jgi:hypothetical protein
VTGLRSRLRRLEQRQRPQAQPSVKVYWHDALRSCQEHPGCNVEIATGEHLRGVFRLAFEAPRP